MAMLDDQNDTLDRSSYLMADHENYETPLDWPENVFGEEVPDGDDDDPAAPTMPDEGDGEGDEEQPTV